jgi:hypothetical protein
MENDDWKKKTVSPKHQTPPKVDISHPCPGISRFFGMVGSVAAALTIFYGGSQVLGIPPLDWTTPAWTTKHIVLVVVAVIFGAVAGLLGFGVGMMIKVRSERLNHLYIVLWQFLANGSLLWILLIGIAMSISLGKDEAKAAVLRFGAERAIWHVIVTGTAVSLSLGLMFFLVPILRSPIFGYLFPAIGVSLLTAKWHFHIYGIQGHSWIMAGLAFPIGLLIFCPPMIARDHHQRRLALEMIQ